MSNRVMLKDEIRSEFEELSKLGVGTDEYKIAVDGLVKLIDRDIEIEKVENERKQKELDREIDMNLKLKQMEDENRDRKIKNGIAVAGIVIPAGLTIWGALKSWEFEREGVVTSAFGRMFLNSFRLKK